MINMKYIKNNINANLRIIEHEISTKNGYRWVARLSLVDKYGNPIINIFWKTNQLNEATNYINHLGWNYAPY